MDAWKHSNIIDELCHRLGFDGPTELARLLGVTRQRINGWKNRNRIPREYCRLVHEKSGIPLSEVIDGPVAQRITVTMKDFIEDVPHFIQQARLGTPVIVTVKGKPDIQLLKV